MHHHEVHSTWLFEAEQYPITTTVLATNGTVVLYANLRVGAVEGTFFELAHRNLQNRATQAQEPYLHNPRIDSSETANASRIVRKTNNNNHVQQTTFPRHLRPPCVDIHCLRGKSYDIW
jgi:hypothetical protein